MVILHAVYQKMFPKKKYLSDIQYDVKTSDTTFLLIMSWKCMINVFFKTIFIFVRQ